MSDIEEQSLVTILPLESKQCYCEPFGYIAIRYHTTLIVMDKSHPLFKTLHPKQTAQWREGGREGGREGHGGEEGVAGLKHMTTNID